ncbi:MAG: alanine--tRNA ligase [Planctomycetes bacterium]|nr:alanine--tRNA ligase [Planctomycetota bacterium]
MPTSREIRQQYIDFFTKKHAHAFVASSPVVPHDDPTLLFTNAGMNQFKPYFLGTAQAPWKRVANTQKCIRAGGKHNDLDDVGRSRRHHTFFEMLGNWSFGDYFKEGAIEMAWELLTKVWGIDPTRLHVSCYEGDPKAGIPRDTEAADIWKKVAGLPEDRIHYFGKDNFWEMGDTGPCGPCTEIYIDRTPDKSGGPEVNGNDPRVMEIWNLVFIQFNRDAAGKLTPLPAQHVDTGMGFERICQVLQDKSDNFGIDLWSPIFDAIAAATGHKYTGKFTATNSVDAAAESADPQLRTDIAFRVIADHVRCVTFALTDGAVPSNEGRGYVLRRILRRAVRFGRQQLGAQGTFIHKLVSVIVEAMGDTFPELRKNPQRVVELIKEEEESFGRTLDRGIQLFERAAIEAIIRSPQVLTAGGPTRHIRDDGIPPESVAYVGVGKLDEKRKQVTIPQGVEGQIKAMQEIGVTTAVITAEDAFRLHDTYGFPLDLTQVMAAERGMTVDVEGFGILMEKAREQARSGGAEEGGVNVHEALVNLTQHAKLPETHFVGYEHVELREKTACRLFALHGHEFKATPRAKAGDRLAVVVGRTPFYAESGGQVGDVGTITSDRDGRFRVEDTQKIGDIFFHIGVVERGEFIESPAGSPEGVQLTLSVDKTRRAKVMANHTTTHVMNRALRAHVSKTADQRGSLVDDEKLRFDFSHNAAVTAAQIEAVEKMVNADIAANLPVYTDYAPQEQALKITGLRAVFGEKYPPKVRVVSVGVPVKDLLSDPGSEKWASVSIEFCGGTHMARTGDAKGFAIIAEEAVGKGVRRITALTGESAKASVTHGESFLNQARGLKGASADTLPAAIAKITAAVGSGAPLPTALRARLNAEIAELQKIVKEYEKEKSKGMAATIVQEARQAAEIFKGGPIFVHKFTGGDAESLKAALDVLQAKLPGTAVFAGTASQTTVSFIASVPQELIKKGLKAGDWVKEAAKVTGGGGRPDMAQAGGKDPAKLDEALEAARKFAAGKV